MLTATDLQLSRAGVCILCSSSCGPVTAGAWNTVSAV